MKGYKALTASPKLPYNTFVCKGMWYQVGKTYTLPSDQQLKICECGYHFCTRLTDCFLYYQQNITDVFNEHTVICEVEATGEIQEEGNTSKKVTSQITIVKRLTEYEIEDTIKLENVKFYDFFEKKSCEKPWLSQNNLGENNLGVNNIGSLNDGIENRGTGNEGNYNIGIGNQGNGNIGYFNKGNNNYGSFNTGEDNNGKLNIGNNNQGICNIGFKHFGLFNIKNSTIYYSTIAKSFKMFNKNVAISVDSISILKQENIISKKLIKLMNKYYCLGNDFIKLQQEKEYTFFTKLPNFNPDIFYKVFHTIYKNILNSQKCIFIYNDKYLKQLDSLL